MQPLTALLDTRTKEWRILLEDASDARYVASGHILFLRQGVLMAIPFDLKKKKVIGRPVSVVTGVMHALNSGHSMYHTAAGQYSVSSSGSLAYASGGILPDRQSRLYWVDMRGNEELVCSLKFPFFCPRLSPDGKKILYQSLGMERHIYLYDIERDIHTNFISEGYTWYPMWSPDGKSIFFNWTEMIDPGHIYRQASDKSTEKELIFAGQESEDILRYPACLSWDGTKMAFLEPKEHEESQTSYDIMIYDFLTQSITPFALTNAHETHPDFSPDDRWLAYCSDETGRREVFVSSVSGSGAVWQVSREGGREPIWARNGRQLYYRSLSGEKIWIVDIQANQTIKPGSPRLLFEITDYQAGGDLRNYDLSLDEKSFLMVKYEERKLKPVTEIVLIQNWFEELKRLVPIGK
jgi:serine/threonine-protein kinase